MFLAAWYAYKKYSEAEESQSTESSNDTSTIMSTQQEQQQMCETGSPTPSPTSIIPDIFRHDVRQEWIDAVFGPRLFYGDEPPRRGVGLSGIPSFVTSCVNIPANSCDSGDKVGITLSRISLGLYVRHVETGSEAFFAGIQEGSVLVDINGMGILCEPARQALERMWQYEGHFEEFDDSSNATPSSSEKESITRPLALRFIKNGNLYTAIMLSSPPFGISWAPCGNFALVQRTYSFASEAGARRGCLVASVNGRTMRDMDHHDTAAEIREHFTKGNQISLCFAYTPVASRCGYYERHLFDAKKRTSPNNLKRKIASADGVQVHAHPIEYNLSSLWCGAGDIHLSRKPSSPGIKRSESTSLASRVAAGEIEAPTGIKRNRSVISLASSTSGSHSKPSKNYAKCPTLCKGDLIRLWDPIEALVFCLQGHVGNYDDRNMILHTSTTQAQLLQNISQRNDGWKLVNNFLLQWVSVLCMSDEEKAPKPDRPPQSQELASMLLELSRRDDSFCQRLHFILRSFIATLESHRKMSRKEESTTNLVTLLQALDRLRNAQKQLLSQLTKKSPVVGVASVSRPDEAAATIAPPPPPFPRTMPPMEAAPNDQQSKPSKSESSKRGKSVFKIFRKKGNKTIEVNSNKGDVAETAPVSPKSMPLTTTNKPVPSNKRSTSEITYRTSPLKSLSLQLEYLPVSSLLENMTLFLNELDEICDTVEGSLLKSISQKIADWALQWSESKENALAKVTNVMRDSLREMVEETEKPMLPLVNPIQSKEVLVSIDADECYILPSAHFPLLLTFNVDTHSEEKQRNSNTKLLAVERLYRTKVEVVGMRGPTTGTKNTRIEMSRDKHAYIVQGAVSGSVMSTSRSSVCDRKSTVASWASGNIMTFDTRSSWGAPQTLSLQLLSVALGIDCIDQVVDTDQNPTAEVGSCWIDLNPLWTRTNSRETTFGESASFATVSCHAQIWSLETTEEFNEHGEIKGGLQPTPERLELELKVTTEVLPFDHTNDGFQTRKRMLLYKHDDDLRQEMFAIHFIETCDAILKYGGLDLKLLTFGCIAVGNKRGFIEWVPGSVPMSDICRPFAVSLVRRGRSELPVSNEQSDAPGSISGIAKAGLMKHQFLHTVDRGTESHNSLLNNPIQDFLRSVAYDPDAPYLIRRSVMDNYIKSCAGYCVITYILGVGDRHLDNLLLHHTGQFFHCDFSFIFGSDPKKYLPLRITEDMVHGMGGKESDNYAKFISLAGAAFVALRRRENVRALSSLLRLMMPAALPDVSINQSPERCLNGMLERLRLDMSDANAISFMEQLIEEGISSRIWLAVDAIHSLGKRL